MKKFENREVRVFISSTFRGMNNDRKVLYYTRSQTKLSCHFDDRRNLVIVAKDFSYRRNEVSVAK